MKRADLDRRLPTLLADLGRWLRGRKLPEPSEDIQQHVAQTLLTKCGDRLRDSNLPALVRCIASDRIAQLWRQRQKCALSRELDELATRRDGSAWTTDAVTQLRFLRPGLEPKLTRLQLEIVDRILRGRTSVHVLAQDLGVDRANVKRAVRSIAGKIARLLDDSVKRRPR